MDISQGGFVESCAQWTRLNEPDRAVAYELNLSGGLVHLQLSGTFFLCFETGWAQGKVGNLTSLLLERPAATLNHRKVGMN